MSASAKQIIEQQKQLQHRVATQQGRLSEHQKRYESAKADMEGKFGTSNIEILRGYYRQLNEHRQEALKMRTELNGLVEQALDYIEKGESAPADLIQLVEVNTQKLQQWVAKAPSFNSAHQQTPASDVVTQGPPKIESEPADIKRPQQSVHSENNADSSALFEFTGLGVGHHSL